MPKHTLRWYEASDRYLPLNTGVIQLADLVMAEGEHLDILLRKTKLFSEDLTLPTTRISPTQLAQLYYNALILLNNAELPLRLGQQLLPSSLNAMASGLMHAPDMQRALNFLLTYQPEWTPLVRIHQQVSQDSLHWYFSDAFGLLKTPEVWHFAVISLMEALRSTFNWLGDSRWEAQWQYDVTDMPEDNLLECQGRWSGRIDTQQRFACLSIPKSQLAQPLRHGSLSLYQITLAQSQAADLGLLSLVQELLRQQIDDVPSLQSVSEQLNLSPATLKRKLKAHGTSYQKLVDQVRAQISYFYASKLGYNDEEIAERLGFYDTSNLRRAMRRWVMA